MIDQAQRERMKKNRENALHRLYSRRIALLKKEDEIPMFHFQLDNKLRDGMEVAAQNEETGISSVGSKGQVGVEAKFCGKNMSLDKSSMTLTSLENFIGHKSQELGFMTESFLPKSEISNPIQAFDYLVVIDFEATCDRNSDLNPQEIIEFPSVLVSFPNQKLDGYFHTFVKPIFHPLLTDFCRQFTGINQNQVDDGVTLGEALDMHDKWLEERGVKDKKFAVLTWSDWDCKVMLESECKWKGLKKPPYFNRWINLRIPFQAAFPGLKYNLKGAVEAAGLKWEGRPHSGLDDALNTARLAMDLMRRGMTLTITNSFKIYDNDGSSIYIPKLRKPVMNFQKIPTNQEREQLSVVGDFMPVKDGEEGCMICFCGELSKKRMVKKPGPTHGKYFFACGKWTMTDGGQCQFFEWAPSALPSNVESECCSSP